MVYVVCAVSWLLAAPIGLNNILFIKFTYIHRIMLHAYSNVQKISPQKMKIFR